MLRGLFTGISMFFFLFHFGCGNNNTEAENVGDNYATSLFNVPSKPTVNERSVYGLWETSFQHDSITVVARLRIEKTAVVYGHKCIYEKFVFAGVRASARVSNRSLDILEDKNFVNDSKSGLCTANVLKGSQSCILGNRSLDIGSGTNIVRYYKVSDL